MDSLLHPSTIYITDIITQAALLIGLFLLIMSWWRTHGRLARFLRQLIEVFGLLLLRQVLLFIGGERFAYWPFVDAGILVLAAVIFFLSQTTLFAIIRSLSTEYRK